MTEITGDPGALLFIIVLIFVFFFCWILPKYMDDKLDDDFEYDEDWI